MGKDVDSLRKHVDAYASKREQQAFEVERSALHAEIAQLRGRLADSEAKVVRLELMLPSGDSGFRRLRAELEELEQEADHFSALYERQAAANKAALTGFRQALEDVEYIEQELVHIQRIIATLPEPAAAGGAVHGQAPGSGPAGAAAVPQQPLSAPLQPMPAAVVTPRACCGCFPFSRR